jgi:hypothetical protein
MLVFHSAYIYDDINELGLEVFVQSGDAGNFLRNFFRLALLPVCDTNT